MKINISKQESTACPPYKILDISWGTIVKISLTIVCLYFFFLIRELFIWFIFALVISILFEPAIRLLSKRGIPRVVAVTVVYACLFGFLTYAVYLSLPFFIVEIQNLTEAFPKQLPEYFEKISPALSGLGVEAFNDFDTFMESVRRPFDEMAKSVFSTLITFLGGFLATFFTISMAFFLSMEQGLMEKGLTLFFPKRYEAYLANLWKKSKEKVVGWFLMRLIGVVFVGVSSYFSLKLLGVSYPASLAAVMGIFDFIPIIGPLIATVFVLVIVSMDSFLKAGFVLAALVLIQVIENTLLLPALSRKIIKVPAIIVLVGLFIGGRLWGVLGAILAVPLFAILFEFLRDFLREKKEELFSNPEDQESSEETE